MFRPHAHQRSETWRRASSVTAPAADAARTGPAEPVALARAAGVSGGRLHTRCLSGWANLFNFVTRAILRSFRRGEKYFGGDARPLCTEDKHPPTVPARLKPAPVPGITSNKTNTTISTSASSSTARHQHQWQYHSAPVRLDRRYVSVSAARLVGWRPRPCGAEHLPPPSPTTTAIASGTAATDIAADRVYGPGRRTEQLQKEEILSRVAARGAGTRKQPAGQVTALCRSEGRTERVSRPAGARRSRRVNVNAPGQPRTTPKCG